MFNVFSKQGRKKVFMHRTETAEQAEAYAASHDLAPGASAPDLVIEEESPAATAARLAADAAKIQAQADAANAAAKAAQEKAQAPKA